MSCCGKSRERMTTKTSPAVRNSLPSGSSAPSPPGAVAFEYTGRTRLTIVGPVTHTRYEFAGFGARVQVDPRDSPSVATVPALRRV
jgi:hypothetical protein